MTILNQLARTLPDGDRPRRRYVRHKPVKAKPEPHEVERRGALATSPMSAVICCPWPGCDVKGTRRQVYAHWKERHA